MLERRDDNMIQSLLLHKNRRGTSHGSRVQECIDFVKDVSTRFQNQDTFSKFINLMVRKETQKKSDSDLVSEIAILFGHHSDLTQRLRQLLLRQDKNTDNQVAVQEKEVDERKSETQTSQTEKKRIESGMIWCRKIQSKLQNSEEYREMLRCLYDYSTKNIDKIELISRFQKKLGMNSELMVNLREFLDHRGIKRKGVAESAEELDTKINNCSKQPKPSTNNKLSSRQEEAQRLINNDKYFAWEDDRHLLDVQLQSIKSVSRKCKQWMCYMKAAEEEEEGYWADMRLGKEPKGRDYFLSVVNKACIQGIYREAEQRKEKLDYSSILSKIRGIRHNYEKDIWTSLATEDPRIILPLLRQQLKEVKKVLYKKIESNRKPPKS